MKTSTYKKWMSVGLLTEEDILNKKIKDKDHPEGVLVKTALDDPNHTLHKKAKAMVDAGDGKSDDDAKVKKQTKIDTNPFDDEKPSDEPKNEPSAWSQKAQKAKDEFEDLSDPDEIGDWIEDNKWSLSGGKLGRAAELEFAPVQKAFDELEDAYMAAQEEDDWDAYDKAKEDLTKLVDKKLGSQMDKKPSDEPKGEPEGGDEPSDEKFQAATDKVADLRASHKGSMNQLIDDLERMKKSEVEDIQSTLSAEKERLLQKATGKEDGIPTFDNEEDTEAYWAASKDASDFYNMTHHYADRVRYKPEDKEESIKVINGKKYKAIKESKKSEKHPIKEQYERLFSNRNTI